HNLGVRGWVEIDLRYEGAGLLGERSEGRCRVHDSRCADDEQHFARAHGGETAFEVHRVQRFPEPDDVRTQQPVARWAAWWNGDRHRAIRSHVPALTAPDLPDVPVDLGELLGAGGRMQPVHILRDQPEAL